MQAGFYETARGARVHWGAGSVRTLGGELNRLSARRAFVVTTRSVGASPELAGALERVLDERLVGRFSGIREHSPAATIEEAIAAARAAEPDVLISLGGGSAIDATKTVAAALPAGVDVVTRSNMLWAVERAGHRILPHVAIPLTLSAAEASSQAAFTSEEEREKTGFGHASLAPSVVLYDADYAVQTPLPLWLSTGLKALDHAVEGLFSGVGTRPVEEALLLASLARLPEALRAAKKDPADRSARGRAQVGAWLAQSLPAASTAGLSHVLGKRIGAPHGIPHGVTSCILLPHVIRHRGLENAAAIEKVASALGCGGTGLEPGELVERTAAAVEALIRALGLPQRLGAYGLGDADLEAAALPLARESHAHEDAGERKRPPLADLLAILRAAR